MASEVALARRDSPARGGLHLGFAKALVYEMPHTLAALEHGVLSEWRATLIVRESACLDVEDRRALDRELCADLSRLEGLGTSGSSPRPNRSPTAVTPALWSIAPPKQHRTAPSPSAPPPTP